MPRVFPLVLAAGVTLLSTASALLLLGYLSQVRQPMGVVRDALIIETARSQENVASIASLKQFAGIDNSPRAHELTQVAEVLGGAAAASWAFQSFQDSQRKQAVSAANAESKERLEERRKRAFIEPRESWREADLKDYDGTDYDGPILLGADGRVFNVWRGRHFYAPGGPYASMAGRDATRQLAKNRLDGDPDYEPDDGAPLNPAERASLALAHSRTATGTSSSDSVR